MKKTAAFRMTFREAAILLLNIHLKRLPLQLPRLFEAFGDLRPVDDLPPVGDVFGPFILVLQVIGMLPDVNRQQGTTSHCDKF